MLSPLQNNSGKTATAKSGSWPAPVKGWNAKDALADMPVDSAVVLDNIWPSVDRVELRKGFSSYATGLGSSNVDTVAAWAGPGSSVFLGCANGAIYDISSAGAVGAAMATGKTSNQWQTTMFSTSGGNFLWMCNGADAPIYFDGSTFTTPSLTGVTPANIVSVMAHQSRLFFLFNDSMEIGFLPVTSVAGAVSTLNLGPFFKHGGRLEAMGSWTRDGGSGANDVACFITSQGEVAVYSGNAPPTTSWVLEGVFQIAPPIGRRSTFKIGPDLIVITKDGFAPLSEVLPIDRAGGSTKYLSNNIQTAVNTATKTYGSYFGWQPIFYPRSQMGVFNIPQSTDGATFHQYVLNTATGAWARFKAQNARCWGVYNDRLYFGGTDGKVYLADDGTSDNGSNIEFDIKPAFNYLGSKGRKKLVTMVRPNVSSVGLPALAIDLNVDFDDTAPTSIPTTPAVSGAIWDTSLWDVDVWGGDENLVSQWLSVTGMGMCISPRIRGATNSASFAFASYDVVWQEGNVL